MMNLFVRVDEFARVCVFERVRVYVCVCKTLNTSEHFKRVLLIQEDFHFLVSEQKETRPSESSDTETYLFIGPRPRPDNEVLV